MVARVPAFFEWMGMKRVLLGVVVAFVFISHAEAAYANCPVTSNSGTNSEKGIFWKMLGPGGQNAPATGVMSSIYVTNQSNTPTCSQQDWGIASNGQTTRMQLWGIPNTYVEVGYKQHFCSFTYPPTTRCWTVFTETNLNGNPAYQHNYGPEAFPCVNQAGALRIFLEYLIPYPGLSNGHMAATNYVQCSAGSGWVYIDYVDAGFYTWGYPEGESFQKIDTDGTYGGMTGNYQTGMLYRDYYSGQWVSPSGTTCRRDNSDGINFNGIPLGWSSNGLAYGSDGFQIVHDPAGNDCSDTGTY